MVRYFPVSLMLFLSQLGCEFTSISLMQTLVEEAEYWWENTHQCLQAEGQDVTWDVFKRVFLEKYFPKDVRNKNEMEFLELKQGNMTVAEYAAKFEELVRYFPHYQGWF